MTWDACVWRDVPDAIKAQGEFATMKFLGHAEGDRRFDEHRRTWITESDIAEIKRCGLNVVRVPVGYWIMGDDPKHRRVYRSVQATELRRRHRQRRRERGRLWHRGVRGRVRVR